MGFDLGALLKDVSKLDTNREQIEYIPLEKLDADEGNFYGMSEIEALADNIALCGLQQPIRLREKEDGRYKIVSGHRRRAALMVLVADGYEQYREAPCIVEQDSVSPTLQQLRLIYANANTRKMSPAEISEQAVQVEKLLYQLKEEGYDFPGRMRDHVAEAVSVSKSKLARLKVIREGLAECWQKPYKKNQIKESVAYALAKLPTDYQQCIFDGLKDKNGNISYLYEGYVNTYKERLDGIGVLKCKEKSKAPCSNAEKKRKQAICDDPYAYNYSCSKCCNTCNKLASCKNACPMLADKIKKLKSDAKEARRQEKLAQEERDRPTIEQLQSLWMRFGYAREQAGKSVKEVYNAVNIYYSQGDDKKVADLENCTTNITVNTSPPYGSNFYLWEINRLIAIADMFGCSIDYLLCRTDIPELAQALPAPEENVSYSGTGWQSGKPSLLGDYIILVRFPKTSRLIHQKMTWNGNGWEVHGEPFEFDDAQVVCWIPMPNALEKPKPVTNESCITGMNPNGHCGSAACCTNEYACCLQCPETCNVRCGWIQEES